MDKVIAFRIDGVLMLLSTLEDVQLQDRKKSSHATDHILILVETEELIRGEVQVSNDDRNDKHTYVSNKLNLAQNRLSSIRRSASKFGCYWS